MWKYKNILITNFLFFITTFFYLYLISKNSNLKGIEFNVILGDYTYMFVLSVIIFMQTDNFMQNDFLFLKFQNMFKLQLFYFIEISKKTILFFLLYFLEMIFLFFFIINRLELMQMINIVWRVIVLTISYLSVFALIISGHIQNIRRNTVIALLLWNLCIIEIILLGVDNIVSTINPLGILYDFDSMSIIRFVIVLFAIILHSIYKSMNERKGVLDEKK